MKESKVNVKFRGGAVQHYSLNGLFYSDPKEFLHSSLEALHTSGVQRRRKEL
jgi:hypothetical protein